MENGGSLRKTQPTLRLLHKGTVSTPSNGGMVLCGVSCSRQPTSGVDMSDTVTKCNGCGMYRLCREYEGLWLCTDGPAKCWKRRKAVKAKKESER